MHSSFSFSPSISLSIPILPRTLTANSYHMITRSKSQALSHRALLVKSPNLHHSPLPQAPAAPARVMDPSSVATKISPLPLVLAPASISSGHGPVSPTHLVPIGSSPHAQSLIDPSSTIHVQTETEPCSVTKALLSSQWMCAMQAEFQALQD
ncbi:hypothetical protein U1Q18_031046 [Sarracenia purpurea var. burkii]